MDRIGKYEILHEIGQGGMGIVYKARDPVIGRDVAIKVIQERILDAPKLKKRFYREARSAGRLSHPHITTLYDIGEDDGTPYLVMEFLSGTDLRTLMQRRHAFTLEEKIDIACQISEGLRYAHQNNVIHRDIKPDNVRILTRNRVKIMDFGIARLDEDTQTLTKESIGTPRYMSPEQIRGDAVDARTDIFSFGVLIYEFLMGTSPFEGDRVTTVIYKILHEHPPPITLDDTPLADDLQQIVARCLEKDPTARYPRFEAVLRDLSTLGKPPTRATPTLTASLGEDLPTGEARSSPLPGAASTSRRRYAMLGVAALLIAAAGGYALFGPSPAPSASSEGPPATRSAPLVDSEESPPTETTAPAAEAIAEDSNLAPASGPSGQVEDAPGPSLSTPSIQPESAPEAATASEPTAESAQSPSVRPALSQAADSARRAVQQARSAVVDQRSSPAAASLFGRAEARGARGNAHYDAGDFTAALRAYREAQALYVQIEETLADEQAAARRIEAEQQSATAARARMQTARAVVDPDRRHHAPFQQAEQRAAEAGRAFDRRDYAGAAPIFDEAAALYAQAAALPTRAEEAQRILGVLAARCQSAFEREDIEALRALSPFYGNWANFFALADDITAQLTSDQFRLTNGRASAIIRFQLEYRDNKNRTQRSQFTHSWTLTQRDQSWVLTDVVAQ
jgi:serine/threonine-protein kinase